MKHLNSPVTIEHFNTECLHKIPLSGGQVEDTRPWVSVSFSFSCPNNLTRWNTPWNKRATACIHWMFETAGKDRLPKASKQKTWLTCLSMWKHRFGLQCSICKKGVLADSNPCILMYDMKEKTRIEAHQHASRLNLRLVSANRPHDTLPRAVQRAPCCNAKGPSLPDHSSQQECSSGRITACQHT